ncbi:MAG TPA: heavy metal-responsive transcriptional regulator [Actinomycetota bacterium]|nr:heavy metal-responsive transcriptional regulator [Actinomycetota bacterium]
MTLTVSQLAERAGVPPDTVRYYEKEGLLPEPARTASGYRQYGDEDAERLRFIRGAQRVGLRLREIRELLEVWDRGLCPCGHTKELAERRISEVDAEIERLQAVRASLEKLAHELPAANPPRKTDRWSCELDFIERG